MCNLYSLNKKRDAVARFFRVSHNRAAVYEPASAIFPRHVAPVVRRAADGGARDRHDELGLHLATWTRAAVTLRSWRISQKVPGADGKVLSWSESIQRFYR